MLTGEDGRGTMIENVEFGGGFFFAGPLAEPLQRVGGDGGHLEHDSTPYQLVTMRGRNPCSPRRGSSTVARRQALLRNHITATASCCRGRGLCDTVGEPRLAKQRYSKDLELGDAHDAIANRLDVISRDLSLNSRPRWHSATAYIATTLKKS